MGMNLLLFQMYIVKDKTEIILTGRNPEEKYVEISDYISEINCIKHPFESGVNARKGIEY